MANKSTDRKLNKGKSERALLTGNETSMDDNSMAPAPNSTATPEDRVYRALYEGILDQRLAPGTKLKEVPLAGAFGVTRGVVRKALTRLAAVKLVTMRAQHGATVASPSSEEVEHIFAARRLVETAVIDSLIARISARQVKELRTLMKYERDSYRDGDMTAGIKLSMDFHVALANYAGNTVLAEFLQQLVVRTPLIFLTRGGAGHTASCSDSEHGEIINAIVAGDRTRAVKCMEEHLRHLESHIQREVATKPTDLAGLLGLDPPAIPGRSGMRS